MELVLAPCQSRIESADTINILVIKSQSLSYKHIHFIMKVISLFATLNVGVLAFTPQASRSFATRLSASKKDETNDNQLVKGALAFFTGLAAAGQIALADPSVLIDNTIQVGMC